MIGDLVEGTRITVVAAVDDDAPAVDDDQRAFSVDVAGRRHFLPELTVMGRVKWLSRTFRVLGGPPAAAPSAAHSPVRHRDRAGRHCTFDRTSLLKDPQNHAKRSGAQRR